MDIRDFLSWFAGGRDGYMTLAHCMNHDTFWIALTVVLDLAVALGYVLIALHWWHNERRLEESPAKGALRSMKNIFLLCGICGYVFIPVKMVWPAWRLYDGFVAILVYFTWRYAFQARNLGVVYSELGRAHQLAVDLEETREESRRKSFFLNAVSHDLKTPLNGLMLQAELAELSLAGDNPDHESIRDAMIEIRSCARTTADLLNSFMEIGRLDWSESPTVPVPLELVELLRSVVARHRTPAEQKGLVLLCQAPSRMIVASDRMKLERILSNLVDNAVKFTKTGSVELVVETRSTDVAIHVSDTGEGIAVEDQSAIFSDFFQVHNQERDSRKGFGLGLAIARRLARQLGGDLMVESTPGRGSRFTLVLTPGLGDSRAGTPGSGQSGPNVAGKTAPALG
jgi:signal transduction histidine kinase